MPERKFSSTFLCVAAVLLTAACHAETEHSTIRPSPQRTHVSADWLRHPPNAKARKFFEQGRKYAHHQQHAPAVEALEHSVRADSQFAEGYLRLGESLLWLGHIRRALEVLATADTLVPDDPDILTEIAMAHLLDEHPQQALPPARRAHARDPLYPRATFVLAMSLAKQGHEREALPYLLQCREYSVLARFLSAQLLVEYGRAPEATKDLLWLSETANPFQQQARVLLQQIPRAATTREASTATGEEKAKEN